VFLAICGEARRYGEHRIELPVSERRVAELAGVSRKTAGKALGRLIDRGFLRVVRCADLTQARRLQVRWPFEVHKVGQGFTWTEGPTRPLQNPGLLTAPVAVVWGHAALGRTCQRLVECLEAAAPSTDKEWQEAAGVKRRAFYSAKRRLIDESIVVRNAEGVYRTPEDLLQRLTAFAVECGAVERHERKVLRHALDRIGYAKYQLWSSGLDERYTFEHGRYVSRSTGEVKHRDEVFSFDNRRSAERPERRTLADFRSTWRCPLIPHVKWAPYRDVVTAVSVFVRRTHLAVAA
jgi:hypothetical protein